jgi:hypothetical protein
MVRLSWTVNSSNQTGFNIDRSQGSSSLFNPFISVAANTTTYLDYAVQPSTRYSYRVRAFDSAGAESNNSNVATATTAAQANMPGVPSLSDFMELTNFAACGSDGFAVVHFKQAGYPFDIKLHAPAGASITRIIPLPSPYAQWTSDTEVTLGWTAVGTLASAALPESTAVQTAASLGISLFQIAQDYFNHTSDQSKPIVTYEVKCPSSTCDPTQAGVLLQFDQTLTNRPWQVFVELNYGYATSYDQTNPVFLPIDQSFAIACQTCQ